MGRDSLLRWLLALQVTPMSLNAYLAYRLSAPMVVSVAMTVASFPIAGLGELSLLALVVAAAPMAMAPLTALALAAFAQNKVQGFALTKASGIFLIAPSIAYFITSPWQLAFGIVPTYWPARVYWALGAGESEWVLYFLVGMGYLGLLLAALVRCFTAVLRR